MLFFIPLIIYSCKDRFTEGCIDSQAINYSQHADFDNGTCEYLEIGTFYQGGIVFYIDDTGLHGLLTSPYDLNEFVPWGCSGITIFNHDVSAFGLGNSNSISIANICNESPNAAEQALSYEIENYSDWYLPSVDELYLMYTNIGQGSEIGNIANLASSAYWSSSENGSDNAWGLSFGSGIFYSHPKGQYWRARAIRSF